MKGKNTFTLQEYEELKRLVELKVTSTPDKQKEIRNKIRKIGFYFSDFSSDKKGYTVDDLESLVRRKLITIKGVSQPKPLIKSTATDTFEESQPDIDIHNILSAFQQNQFGPKIHASNVLPDSPGNYIICLRVNSHLPSTSVGCEFKQFNNQDVIYTGVASLSLRKRDYRQHFNGNAGSSTLRKSLGVLLGYTQIPRDKNPLSRKTKFGAEDEQALSLWMKENLIMYFLPNDKIHEVEKLLINWFNPPLNLQSNKNIINIEFRRNLSALRSKRF